MRNAPILFSALVMSAIVSILWTVVQVSIGMGELVMHHTSWLVALEGLDYTVQLALIVGAFELASRLHGRAALGAKLAALAYSAGFALGLVRSAAFLLASPERMSDLYALLADVGMVIHLGAIAGFAVAAWDDRRRAIAGVAVAIAAAAWPFVYYVSQGDDHAWHVHLIAGAITACAGTGAIGALAWTSRPAEPVPSAALASRALGWMAGSLSWRLVFGMIAALAGATALGLDHTAHVNAFVLGWLVIELALLVVFAVATLAITRAALPGSPRAPFIAAGFGVLWSAGTMLDKVPNVLATVVTGARLPVDVPELLDAATVAAPMVMLASVVFAALALRRVPALAELADVITSRTLAFACTTLVSIGCVAWVARPYDQTILLPGLVAQVAALVGFALLITVFRRAAAALASGQPDLPAARVV